MAILRAADRCAADDLGLAAGEDFVWIYQTRVEPPDSVMRLHFGFMILNNMNLNKPSPRFRPLNQEEIGGEVIRAAVRGRRLHAFFRDGSHFRYEPEVRRVAGPQAAFPELKLPDSFVPRAVAGDAKGDVLYAVVLGRIAEAVDAANAEHDESGDAANSGHPPAAETQPAAADEALPPGLQLRVPPTATPTSHPRLPVGPVLARYCLVRFERGRWHRDREIPSWFDGQSECMIAAEGGTCDLYYVNPADKDRVWFARADGERWIPSAPVAGDLEWNQLRVCARHEGRSLALVAGTSGVNLLTRATDGSWSAQVLPTASDAGEPELLAGVTSQRVVAACKDGKGEVRAAMWDHSGVVQSAPQVVDALRPAPSPRGLRGFREVAPFVVLGFSLFYVFTRRRESVVYPVVLQANQRLVGHGRRLLAFLLDLVIVAPLAVPILYGWTRHLDPEADALEGVQVAMAEHFAELFWRWLIALAALVLYGIIFELARGGTPGKLLLGCRVISERGGACGLRAIVMRNLLRLLELFPGFDFAPLLLLVFLTRNRQRLGDLVARTVVIEVRPQNALTASDDEIPEDQNA